MRFIGRAVTRHFNRRSNDRTNSNTVEMSTPGGLLATASVPKTRKGQVMAVVRVASGNFLEMYDFMVFGYYAAAIGKAFFPTGSEFASLMLSLATFGVGFLMRPLGAVILG